jgi:hypothetical protein
VVPEIFNSRLMVALGAKANEACEKPPNDNAAIAAESALIFMYEILKNYLKNVKPHRPCRCGALFD